MCVEREKDKDEKRAASSHTNDYGQVSECVHHKPSWLFLSTRCAFASGSRIQFGFLAVKPVGTDMPYCSASSLT